MTLRVGDRKTVVGGVCAVLVLLQLVLGGHIDVFGAAPDFMFALTCTVALAFGPSVGCVAGFAAGLLFDLLGGGVVGISALLGCVAGFVLGATGRDAVTDSASSTAFACVAVAFAYNFLQMFVLFLLGVGVELCAEAALCACAGSVLDALVAVAACAAVRRLVRDKGAASGGLRLS